MPRATKTNLNSADEAIAALCQQLSAAANSDSVPGDTLWVADEHVLPQNFFGLAQQTNTIFLSNRFDQHQRALHHGISSYFSDIELAAITEKHFSQIFFRVAKERPLVHHLINQASDLLPPEGKLWLAGYKNEGVKTHIARAEKRLGCKAKITRGPNQLYLAELVKQNTESEKLPDKDYSELRELTFEETTIWSKPGLYGWDKIDPGSKYLMDYLSEQPELMRGKKTLDLGSGYGYLGMRAAELKASQLTAVDNCAAALIACNKNLGDLPLETIVKASDAGSNLTDVFDVILCNPPFHQGFSTTPDLHRKFLANTKRLLDHQGTAWFVVNQFLNIEAAGHKEGLEATEAARSKSYKIMRFSA